MKGNLLRIASALLRTDFFSFRVLSPVVLLLFLWLYVRWKSVSGGTETVGCCVRGEGPPYWDHNALKFTHSKFQTSVLATGPGSSAILPALTLSMSLLERIIGHHYCCWTHHLRNVYRKTGDNVQWKYLWPFHSNKLAFSRERHPRKKQTLFFHFPRDSDFSCILSWVQMKHEILLPFFSIWNHLQGLQGSG